MITKDLSPDLVPILHDHDGCVSVLRTIRRPLTCSGLISM
jgi:hypothetical protein